MNRRGSPLSRGVSLGRDVDFPSASPSLMVPALLWLTPLQELPTFLGPLSLPCFLAYTFDLTAQMESEDNELLLST